MTGRGEIIPSANKYYPTTISAFNYACTYLRLESNIIRIGSGRGRDRDGGLGNGGGGCGGRGHGRDGGSGGGVVPLSIVLLLY